MDPAKLVTFFGSLKPIKGPEWFGGFESDIGRSGRLVDQESLSFDLQRFLFVFDLTFDLAIIALDEVLQLCVGEAQGDTSEGHLGDGRGR